MKKPLAISAALLFCTAGALACSHVAVLDSDATVDGAPPDTRPWSPIGVEPASSCDNGAQDGDEAGVDCGGAHCMPCPPPPCGDAPCTGDYLWSWVIPGTNFSSAHPKAIHANAEGDLAITGVFYGSVDFGDGIYIDTGTEDFFVIKMDGDGHLLWSQPIETNLVYTPGAAAVSVDTSGNVVVAGAFSDTIDFGGSLVDEGGSSGFVAKYGAGGELLWGRSIGSPTAEVWVDKAVTDVTGDVLLMGGFRGSVDFGDGQVTSTEWHADLFVMKLDAAGEPVWSRTFPGTWEIYGIGLGVDGAGGVHFTGSFTGSADLGGGMLESSGYAEWFLVKLDAAGAPASIRHFPTSDNGSYQDLGVNTAGHAVFGGRHSGTIDFGGGPLTSTGTTYDIVVARRGPAGEHLWAKNFAGADQLSSFHETIDEAGNTLLGAIYTGTVDFGGGPLTGPENQGRSFFAKLDHTGAHLWSKVLGNGSGRVEMQSIAVDGAGNLLVTGSVSGMVDLGGGPENGMDVTMFVAKFAP